MGMVGDDALRMYLTTIMLLYVFELTNYTNLLPSSVALHPPQPASPEHR